MKCCEYSARDLRTPCTFERMTRTSDGAGGWTEAWAEINGAPTRCQFRNLTGSERWQAQRTEATTRARIVVRYVPGLTEADRVVIGGRHYAIQWIDNIELRDQWLRIDLDGGVAT